jgi:hypothetical protein
MIGEPPVENPFYQLIPIVLAVVIARMLARLTGALGT